MRRTLKSLARIAAAVALLPLGTAVSSAQNAAGFPDKPVRLIIPYSAGGGTDILGRILGQKLSEMWGQPVVVENRPGASGLVGAKAAMQSKADGYTLVVGSTGTLMSVADDVGTTAKGSFDVSESLAPITMIAAPPYLVAVNPKLGVSSVQDLIRVAKEKKPAVRFGSSGVGSASHLTGELFKELAGVDMLHVPYKGTGQAVTDLLSGEISVMFGPAPTLLPHVEGGNLKAVAVTPAKRSGLFPDLPTVAEAGVSGFESVGWFGLFAPKGTPDAIVQKINDDALKALSSEDVRKQLADQGAEPDGMEPDQFEKFVNSDTMKWIRLRDKVAKS
jgi:tripartite-type tricarboxylate transporter receptor subunit TctC